MRFSEFFERYVFVRKCAGCRELIGYEGRHDAFCPACRVRWEMAKVEACSICGRGAVECECMPRLLSKSGVLTLKKLMIYKPERASNPENRLLYFMKHYKNRRVARFVAEQLSHRVHELMRESGCAREELILAFVPRGRRALAEYGHDQSELIVSELSRILSIETVRLFERRKREREQKKLNRGERAKNAAKSIVLSSELPTDISERSVILFDDIVSSGASMARAASLLHKVGVRNIYAISVAFNN